MNVRIQALFYNLQWKQRLAERWCIIRVLLRAKLILSPLQDLRELVAELPTCMSPLVAGTTEKRRISKVS